MPVDQWFERWADAQIKEIENVDKDAKEKYAELSHNLRKVETDLINVTATVHQLRATLESMSYDFNETSTQLTDMIRSNSDNILRHTTTCPHPKAWEAVWNRLKVLEAAENRREGSGKWEGIIINGIVSIVVAITVIVIAYVMSGGHITSG